MSHPKDPPRTVTRTYEPVDIDLLFNVEDTSDEERTTHEGSCHCGAVSFTVTLKWPFPKYPINSCNCSICTHNGYLFVYPRREDVKFSPESPSSLHTYQFATKTKDHKFCSHCGSSILIDFRMGERDPEKEIDPKKDVLAVNVRNFKNIDLEKMRYTYFDGRTML